MESNFDICLKWLGEHEGGVTNLKNDRGGLTNLGVTHADYDHYRRFRGLPLRSVTLITADEAKDLYHTFYWKTLQCQLLPAGIENAIFDMGVNNGVVGAARAAQRVANKLTGRALDVDGHLGPQSCDVIDDCDPAAFIDSFCDERLRVDSGFFNWKTFGRAWTNRVNGNPKLKITGVRVQSKTLVSNTPRPIKAQIPTQVVYANTFISRCLHSLANLFKRP
jgi:lysozyme family protein